MWGETMANGWTEELEKETRRKLAEIQDKLGEIYKRQAQYRERIIREAGDNPKIGNPHYQKHPRYEYWVMMRAFEKSPPWFWITKEDDPDQVKWMKRILRDQFTVEMVMTPEQLAEYDKFSEEAEPYEVESEILETMIWHKVPRDIAERLVEQGLDGFDSMIIV